jgi:hypothetical protein
MGRKRTPFKEIGVKNPKWIYEGDKLHIVDHTHYLKAPENIVYLDEKEGMWKLKGWGNMSLNAVLSKWDTFKVYKIIKLKIKSSTDIK